MAAVKKCTGRRTIRSYINSDIQEILYLQNIHSEPSVHASASNEKLLSKSILNQAAFAKLLSDY